MASIEVGEKGHKWHVHLLVWGPWVSHAELSEVWRRLTGQQVVWLREVGKTAEEAAGVVGEVLKYATKFVDLSPESLVDLHLALKGRRRVRSWGSFYNSGVTVEREVELCETCRAPMRLVPEWLVDVRLKWLERGDRAGLYLITANKSPPPKPPPGALRAPRRLADGALCSQTPPVTWEQYSQAVGGGR